MQKYHCKIEQKVILYSRLRQHQEVFWNDLEQDTELWVAIDKFVQMCYCYTRYLSIGKSIYINVCATG